MQQDGDVSLFVQIFQHTDSKPTETGVLSGSFNEKQLGLQLFSDDPPGMLGLLATSIMSTSSSL